MFFIFSLPLFAIDLHDASILDRIQHEYRFGLELEIQEHHMLEIVNKVKLKKTKLHAQTLESAMLFVLHNQFLRKHLSEKSHKEIHEAQDFPFEEEKTRSYIEEVASRSKEAKAFLAHHFKGLFLYSGSDPLEKKFFTNSTTVKDPTAYREYILPPSKKIRNPYDHLDLVEGGTKYLGIRNEIFQANENPREASFHHHISSEKIVPANRVLALHDYKIAYLVEKHGPDRFKEITRKIYLAHYGIDNRSFGTNIRDNGDRIEEKLHIFSPKKQLVFTLNILEHPDTLELLHHLYQQIESFGSRKELIRILIGYSHEKHHRDTTDYTRTPNQFYSLLFLKRLHEFSLNPESLAKDILEVLVQEQKKKANLPEIILKNLIASAVKPGDFKLLEHLLEQVKNYPSLRISGEIFQPRVKQNLLVGESTLKKVKTSLYSQDQWEVAKENLSPSFYEKDDRSKAEEVLKVMRQIELSPSHTHCKNAFL